jgi:hypothetical protein
LAEFALQLDIANRFRLITLGGIGGTLAQKRLASALSISDRNRMAIIDSSKLDPACPRYPIMERDASQQWRGRIDEAHCDKWSWIDKKERKQSWIINDVQVVNRKPKDTEEN